MKDFIFALDVDGILTDGKFHWDEYGNKSHKEFGPDDSDALKLIKPYLAKIVLFTQDRKGWRISTSRAYHMGIDIIMADGQARLDYLKKYSGDLEHVIYMGDSFLDVPLLQECKYGITTSDASPYAKKYASYITPTAGGNRAVADAVFWIFKEILKVNKVKLFGDYELEL